MTADEAKQAQAEGKSVRRIGDCLVGKIVGEGDKDGRNAFEVSYPRIIPHRSPEGSRPANKKEVIIDPHILICPEDLEVVEANIMGPTSI